VGKVVEPYRTPYGVSGENGAVATTVLGPPPGPTLVTGRERVSELIQRGRLHAVRIEVSDPLGVSGCLQGPARTTRD
jgi:hypothetical protein